MPEQNFNEFPESPQRYSWTDSSLEGLSKEELYYRIYHDEITGYYNWNYLWARLQHDIHSSDPKYCFVHFDIKGTKILNSTYGHEGVNELLRSVCNQLEKEKENGWVLHACRCDNDNFSMMIKVMEQKEIQERLKKMFDAISFFPSDPTCRIYYRCGVVTAEDAIENDDRVADFAKIAQRYGNKFHQHDINFYTSEMYQRHIKGNEYLSRTDEAIENDEFELWLQPKYDIHSEKIAGAEALVRWNYRHEKLLPPGEFIPVLEQNFVVHKVDAIILKKTCEAIVFMRDSGLTVFPISVNLSRTCIQNENLVQEICSTVDSYAIPHDKIEFELTESAAYEDIKTMFTLLNELRRLDFRVSMDDFGTGYSSLSLLKDMPMDTLKIDKSFVDSIIVSEYNVRENVVIKDIVSMSKHLGFICLAEGAETREQVDFLRNVGCDKIQGFYYSKPVPTATYFEMVRKQMDEEKKIKDN